MESRSFGSVGEKMFRLRDLKNGLFEIHKQHGEAWQGTPKILFNKALSWGIPESELTKAVNKLTATGDDYADFESNGRFKFTQKGKKRNG
jgi:hypothetical protein